MKKLFEHKLALFLIIATLVAAAVIGVFSVQRSKANIVENGVEMVVTGPQKLVSAVSGWLYNITHYFGNIASLKAENEELRDKNVQLEKQVRDMENMSDENLRLKEMLDLEQSNTKLDMIAASIIAKDPSNWYSTLTIDKGTADGLKVNQPVITSQQYLVGQVYRVGTNWAEIITILDPENSVGSTIQPSKDIGIVEGDTSLRYSGQCKIDYLPRDTDIETGDYVETSGLGGVYPKGLLIGKVLEVREDNSTMSKYATIEPSSEISKLNEVFVVTNSFELVGSSVN